MFNGHTSTVSTIITSTLFAIYPSITSTYLISELYNVLTVLCVTFSVRAYAPCVSLSVTNCLNNLVRITEDIVRIYGKRWDIEVFFKMAKQHLKLAKEIQCRDFDALITHTNIVFMRYMFLAYQCRMETDHRTFGDLFYACCEEAVDISFMQALYRILTLAADPLKQLGAFCEKTAAAFFDAIMDTALQCVGLSKNKLVIV
jgi:hypothetical protein